MYKWKYYQKATNPSAHNDRHFKGVILNLSEDWFDNTAKD